MVRLRIVGVAGPTIDYPEVIGEACRALGCSVEVVSQPFCYLSEIRPRHVRAWGASLGPADRDTFTVFLPGQADYFFAGADLSLHFSAYGRWFDPSRMRVIPHPWSSLRPATKEALRWTSKPPLWIGFMGSTYTNSRIGRLIGKAPRFVRDLILRGHHLRSAMAYVAGLSARIPFTYSGTFVRAETIAAMTHVSLPVGGEFRCEPTFGFSGSDREIDAYADHMAWSTYVLCPRGIENYSFRLYEALRMGRVPVIIDTHMVLPEGIDWAKVALIVPYRDLLPTSGPHR